MTQNLSDLAKRVQALIDGYPFGVHWQLRDVTSGQHIGQQDHRVVGAFSTRKVSVLLACLALVKTQRLSLDRTYIIDEALKAGVQAGIMRNLSAGIELSLRDHLTQMMVTSDNICTQIVFRAIDEATGDGLQWVNDYCAHVGLYDTLHREVFPRSAELAWSHSVEQMTVTSARDQALLLQYLGQGCLDADAAVRLGLTTELCQLAVELMGNLYTPMFGARLTKGSFVEKNGRGIRSLSQVGLFLDETGRPIASIAAYAEPIPVELLDGTPGRVRAMEFFVELGQAIEQFYLNGTFTPVPERQVVRPDFWNQELGELVYAVQDGPVMNDDISFNFSGIGKLFCAVTLDALENTQPGLLAQQLNITDAHRRYAETGPLRHMTGALQLSIDDAIRMMIATGDGAATLALLDHLQASGVDLEAAGQCMLEHLPNTVITGLEERSAGEGFIGTTTAADVVMLLRDIVVADGRVMDWMSSVMEPAGLASTLPGYGPHTEQHWTVSGWARIQGIRLDEGRSNVLILQCPKGRRGMVAHAPVGTQDVPSKFGSLGLSAFAAE